MTGSFECDFSALVILFGLELTLVAVLLFRRQDSTTI